MSVILMTTLSYKALILQGEIWYWSLLGLKGLREFPVALEFFFKINPNGQNNLCTDGT